MTYVPSPHFTQNWILSKPSARGRRGIVVSQVRSAAEAGVAVLEAGGNAVDAAVAAALALATVEPWNSGLGGIGFALVHRAGQPTAEVVDFGPVAPRNLNPSAFKLTGRMKQDLFAWPEVEGDANIHGPLSFAIPSSTAGYAHMHSTWGKLPLAEVIAPAIALAKRGLPQDWFTTLKVGSSASVLRRYAESARIYLPDGLPPVAPYQGSPGFFRLGALTDTLEHLGRAGLRDQYEGDIAAAIVADVKEMGGVLSADDLRSCKARILPATQFPWRGKTLQLAGGLTAAPTMIRVLEQMASVHVGTKPDAAWFVAFGRAMKQAYKERLEGLGDADPLAAETCTTHLTVCDEEGTMVAMTTTLLSSMGSRVVLPQVGHPGKQRRHVVRPAPQPAELHRRREAAADQHVTHHPARWGSSVACRRSLRGAADFGVRHADARIRHGLWHEARGRGAPSANRCIRSRLPLRRPALAGGCH